MSKPMPVSFPSRMDYFCKYPQSNKVMFCKRYKAEDIWNIAPGAVLDLELAWPGLVEICRKLYLQDTSWFVGDVSGLLILI